MPLLTSILIAAWAVGDLAAAEGRLNLCYYWAFSSEKDDTPSHFPKDGNPFKSIRKVSGLDDSEDCDLIVRFNRKFPGFNFYAEAYSPISKQVIHKIDERGGMDKIVALLCRSFGPDSILETYLAAERKDKFKRTGKAANSLTQADLQAIKGVLEGGTLGEAAPKAKSDIDQPAYGKRPENQDDFALVIGIERYSELPEARFASRDAEAVKNHLIAQGYPSRNVVHLSGEKAGYSAMKKYLESWLPRNVSEKSRVFFYFSGHGAPDAETREAYLMPWDGDPSFLDATAYPLRTLFEKLGALKAKEVTVALDSCFSGSGGRSVLAKGARPLVTEVKSAAPQSQNIVLFSAAAFTEITGALDDQSHGIFTYYFLKGLSGEAKDRSGHVTARGLYEYLKPRVQDAARRQNRDQTPALAGSDQRVLVRF